MRFVHSLAVLTVLFAVLAAPAFAKGKGGGGGGGGKGSGGGGKQSFGGGGRKGGGHSSTSGGAKQHVKKQAQPTKDKLAKEHGPAWRQQSGSDPLAPNKKEKQLQLFQQQRDKKIAQAEHLRQIAERNGDANLAANADRMEAQALQQYADKVGHLEKFGVTDPLLNPELPPQGDDAFGSLDGFGP